MSEMFEVDVDEAVKTYADMVYRLAVLNMKNVPDAEDVFQEVFLKLLRYKKTIISEEHLKAWLIRVTLNQCKSKAMLNWNKRVVSLDEVAEASAPEEKEDYSEVYEAVRNLPQKYREVIYLYYYDGYKINEIADILQRSEATIKTQLSRGRGLLNNTLKGEFGDAE